MVSVLKLMVDVLVEAGIDHAFGIPGGISMFLFEEIYKRKEQIKTIVARHEGAAAAMADMYGRLTHKPGLLVGQGLWIGTNGAFGVVESFLAGSPMVIITEFSDWYGHSQRNPYQLGTGEYGSVNLPNIFRSMTKYTTVATEPEEIVYGLQLAIKHAISGRPGPTCLITRWNTMMAPIEDPSAMDPPIYPVESHLNVSPPCISPTDAKKISDLLIGATNPVMICGRGIHASSAQAEVQELTELVGMPVATSYLGKGSLAENHDFSTGVMASLGQKVANEVIRRADLILAVGTGLAPENTFNCSPKFIDISRQKIIHIDIDPRNAAWTFPVTLGITSDAKLALQGIISAIRAQKPQIDIQARIADLEALKENPANEFFTSKHYTSDKTPIQPERVVKEFNDILREDDIVVLDGGNNRMWFTKLFQTKKAGQLIGPGGAAGLSWCTGATMCAQMLNPDKKVFGVIGDGGMLMALYALEMVKQYNLPLTYVVFNNSSFGNVRDYLTRKTRGLTEYPETNFADIATTMGVEGVRVEEPSAIRPALEKALASNKPLLLDVIVAKASNLRIRLNL